MRAPLHESEAPAVRPDVLEDDVEAATKAAEAAGAEIAHPPLEIPGQGTFSTFIQGGTHVAASGLVAQFGEGRLDPICSAQPGA